MTQRSYNILRTIVLLISILIIFLRRTSFFLEPRFWAEEGSAYFSFAFSHHWYESLINVQFGYFALWPNIASTIAANLVSLIYAPLVTTLFALVVQIIPIVLILWGHSELWLHPLKKLACIFIIIFTPLSNEIWLNTINSQFYFSVITFLLLLNDIETFNFKKWAFRFLLVCAGLTGCISCFLLPLFFLKARWEHNRERRIQAYILAACPIIQIFALWVSIRNNTIPNRFFILNLPLFGSMLWTQIISLLFFGISKANEFARFIGLNQTNFFRFELIGLLLLSIESLFFFYVSSKLVLRQRVILMGSFFLLIILSIVAGKGNESDKLLLIFIGNSPRYFYAPNVILMFLIIANIKWQGNIFDRIRSCLLTIFLGIALILGSVQYFKFISITDSGPKWTEEILKWKKDQTYNIEIWPACWHMKLSQSPGQ